MEKTPEELSVSVGDRSAQVDWDPPVHRAPALAGPVTRQAPAQQPGPCSPKGFQAPRRPAFLPGTPTK